MQIQLKISGCVLVFLYLLQACTPVVEEDLTLVSQNVGSADARMVYRLQDRLERDSLIDLLSHEKATVRYWASRGLASVQGAEAVDALLPLLKDTAAEVRYMSAYALGQIGSKKAEDALVKAFDQQAATNPLNFYVLQAIGKSASAKYLPLISSVSTYQPRDTQLVEGMTQCIYEYMLRGITDRTGTAKMIEVVNNADYVDRGRLYAANYLFRGQNLGLDTLAVDTSLSSSFTNESDPRIRMVLAIALGKTKTLYALQSLQNQYAREQDYRVKCNIIRALTNFDYLVGKTLVLQAVRDPNLHIAHTAVNFLKENGSSREANSYRLLAKDTTLNPMVQIGLIAAANARMPNYFTDYKSRINYDLRLKYETATDAYEKAEALKGLGYYVRMYDYIGKLDVSQEPAVVKTAQTQALSTIAQEETFAASFGYAAANATQQIGNYLLDAIKGGDVGQMAVAAGALRIPERAFNEILADSVSILKQAADALTLPDHIETYNELQRTIALFEGTTYKQTRPAYNHPIIWSSLTKIRESSRADIVTNKGTIRLRLYPNSSPGSVANFIQLVEYGYFDGTNFHRVVPNFVIQGGGSRGDGYGGSDYSIRSELSPDLYYESRGMVGMASAGNHTESTQFFITHSPALHLNGDYTIFAEVVEGMSVVNDIQVDDKIESVTIEY
ncbi:MAG: peptidylprolyl isomerase [Bacteroidota bacterium]